MNQPNYTASSLLHSHTHSRIYLVKNFLGKEKAMMGEIELRAKWVKYKVTLKIHLLRCAYGITRYIIRVLTKKMNLVDPNDIVG